jgi:hypothetical protein
MCFQWVLKNIDSQFLRHWWSELPLTKLNQILEVLYLTIYNFEYKVSKPLLLSVTQLSFEMAYLWINLFTVLLLMATNI